MTLFEALIEESIKTIENAYGRICHCVEQLNDEDIWFRENEHVNSVGIIIQHLCGNLRQWIIGGIGGKPDVRDRPSEFKDADRTSKKELMNRFQNVIQECNETLRRLPPEELLVPRRIQGFDETVISAMFSSIPHIELHGGQIVYITRLMLQDRYKLRWKPTTKEEGAE